MLKTLMTSSTPFQETDLSASERPSVNEIERMRPFMTSQPSGMSRNGKVDIGTRITISPDQTNTDAAISDVVYNFGIEYPRDYRTGYIRLWEPETENNNNTSDENTAIVQRSLVPQILNYNAMHPLSAEFLQRHYDDTATSIFPADTQTYTTYAQLDDNLWKMAFPAVRDDLKVLLGLRSWSQLHITSATVLRDNTNREVARSSRTITAQTLPSDKVLTQRWTTQADFQLLKSARLANLTHTWPRAVDRFRTKVLPTETNTVSVGIDPAPLRDHHSDHEELFMQDKDHTGKNCRFRHLVMATF